MVAYPLHSVEWVVRDLKTLVSDFENLLVSAPASDDPEVVKVLAWQEAEVASAGAAGADAWVLMAVVEHLSVSENRDTAAETVAEAWVFEMYSEY
jgi:hypothetical protein